MNEQEWLDFALSKMHSGQWFGFRKDWTGEHRMSYENIIVHDSSITKPTEAEVNAKIQELKDAEQAVIDKKASGKQKLKDLGLDDDEINALIGT
jgi:arsenate reductase-like glutaredoxin family protein|tara:strand:- start:35 stop:316 length:282 start_codon:yes stop_codon:yes gene_type:complete